jgi:hypothetical protein
VFLEFFRQQGAVEAYPNHVFSRVFVVHLRGPRSEKRLTRC